MYRPTRFLVSYYCLLMLKLSSRVCQHGLKGNNWPKNTASRAQNLGCGSFQSGHSLLERDAEGEVVMDFAVAIELRIANTFFRNTSVIW